MTFPSIANYQDYLNKKRLEDVASGFDCEPRNAGLFDFQRAIVRWALRRGRAFDAGLIDALRAIRSTTGPRP